jgi:hypothetical protein
VIFKDSKKVSHHRTPQSREGLPTDCDYLALVFLAIRKDYPKEDIKSFPRTRATLLHYYLGRAFL